MALSSVHWAVMDSDPKRQRLFVWDFDQTVLRVHAFGLRLTPADAATRSLEADVADLQYFRAVVAAAFEGGHVVAIASFGLFAVIEVYMNRICPGLFTRRNISTPSCVGLPDGCSCPDGKTPQLALLAASLLRESNEGEQHHAVTFFDDDPKNVSLALAAGFERSYAVPPTEGFTRSLCLRLRDEGKLSESESQVLLRGGNFP